MKEFSYRSINAAGETQTGTIQAFNAAEATADLHSRGLTPIEVSAKGRTLSILLNSDLTYFVKPKERDIFGFLRDLGRLLTAGLSLVDALKLQIDMRKRSRFTDVLTDVRGSIKKGDSLASAMATHSEIFSVSVTAAIHAGENSGTLAETLDTISSSMEQTIAFKEKLRGALIYPAFLCTMVIATFILVMTFVLPQFAPLFVGNEDKLPWATRFVMGIGGIFQQYGGVMLVVFLLLIAFGFWVIKDVQKKSSLLKWLCGISPIARFIETPDLVRFLRTLGVCCQSGMVLDGAFVMAIQSSHVPHMADDFKRARVDVRHGHMLSKAFQKLSYMPALAIQFVMVGEQSGNLGMMLEEAAGILGQDFEVRLEKGLEIMSPILTVLMGGIVALLLGSVLLGIMSISDVAL